VKNYVFHFSVYLNRNNHHDILISSVYDVGHVTYKYILKRNRTNCLIKIMKEPLRMTMNLRVTYLQEMAGKSKVLVNTYSN
jgi:hypothetical protein